MKPLVVIAYGDIALVAPEMSDLEPLSEWIHDPRMNMFLNQDDLDGGVCPRLMQQKQMEEQLSKPGHFMLIFDQRAECVVGSVVLHSVSTYHRYASPGIKVFPTYHGKGVGTQAMRLLLRYAFELQGFHKINLSVWSQNTGAIECYSACGFREIGRHRDHYWQFDRYHDLIDMEILVDEYASLQSQWFI